MLASFQTVFQINDYAFHACLRSGPSHDYQPDTGSNLESNDEASLQTTTVTEFVILPNLDDVPWVNVSAQL